MQLQQKLNRRLAFFLPFMLAGFLLGLIDRPMMGGGVLFTGVMLLAFWLLARSLTKSYGPQSAKPVTKAVLSVLAGLIFSLFWSATSWFDEAGTLLADFPSGTQAIIVAAVSLGIVLAVWKTFSLCVYAFFGDIIREFRGTLGKKK